MPGTSSRLLLGLGLSLLLSACGQAPDAAPGTPGPPEGPPQAVGPYPWTSRLELPVPDPYAAGRRYPWQSPTAGPEAGGVVGALADVTWTSATNDWGPIEFDRSVGGPQAGDGGALTVGGKTFARGLGVHAASEVRYALNGQCTVFSAQVGVDDEVGERGSVTFEVWGGDRRLFASEVRRGTDSALPVRVDVAGVRELRLRVTDAGDGPQDDHADWAEPALTCRAAPPQAAVDLGVLAYTSAANGWGPVELNGSNGEQGAQDGRPLTVGGQKFAGGLGVHAPSVLTYPLGGRCTRLTAQVGVDDEVGNRGSVVFQVWNGAAKLYDSGALTGRDPARAVDVNVTGVRELRLTVTDGGDGQAFDHADWGNARVECAPEPPPAGPPGTVDTSFGVGGRRPYGGVAAALGADGSLFLLNAVTGDFALRRVAPNGETAQVTTDVRGRDLPAALAVQPGGGIVAVGTADGGERVALVRYRPDLTLDSGFGTGGRVVTDLGGAGNPGDNVRVSAVAVRPGGELVVAGAVHHPVAELGGVTSNFDFAVVQYRPDGTLDPGFGRGGVVTTALPKGGGLAYTSDDVLRALALQPDGKIVAVGTVDCAAEHAGIIRYTADGRVDPDFLPNRDNFNQSSSCPDLTGDFYASFGAVALTPEGGIVTGGWTGRFAAFAHAMRFGAGGGVERAQPYRLLEPERPSLHQTRALLVQPDGKLLVNEVGVPAGQPGAIARLNPDLSFDTAFGTRGDGIVPVDARAFLRQPDGRILVVGEQSTVRLWP